MYTTAFERQRMDIKFVLWMLEVAICRIMYELRVDCETCVSVATKSSAIRDLAKR